MSTGQNTSSQETNKATAGLAGAGGGTLLTVFASQLDDGNPLKPLLIYAAPSASIVLGYLSVWIQVKVINFFGDREAQKIIAQAIKILKEDLDNPTTSEEHKANLREKLEQFEMIKVERAMKKLHGTRVINFDDIKPR